jgi:hypothetical protein
MAFASRGNCSLSSVERAVENNSAFSSSSEEGDLAEARGGERRRLDSLSG